MVKKSGESSRQKKQKKSVAQKVTPPQAKPVKTPRKLKYPVKLPNAWRLTKMSADILWRHKKLFIGITLVYGLLNLILVQGLASSTDVASLTRTLNQSWSG